MTGTMGESVELDLTLGEGLGGGGGGGEDTLGQDRPGH